MSTTTSPRGRSRTPRATARRRPTAPAQPGPAAPAPRRPSAALAYFLHAGEGRDAFREERGQLMGPGVDVRHDVPRLEQAYMLEATAAAKAFPRRNGRGRTLRSRSLPRTRRTRRRRHRGRHGEIPAVILCPGTGGPAAAALLGREEVRFVRTGGHFVADQQHAVGRRRRRGRGRPRLRAQHARRSLDERLNDDGRQLARMASTAAHALAASRGRRSRACAARESRVDRTRR